MEVTFIYTLAVCLLINKIKSTEMPNYIVAVRIGVALLFMQWAERPLALLFDTIFSPVK